MTKLTPGDGRRRRGLASRDAVIASALAIAQAEGLDALTFGRLASNASKAKSSVQVLFESREKLQIQTLSTGVDAFAASVVAAVSSSKISARRPLMRLCEAWFDVVVETSGFECGRGCLLTAALSEFRGRSGPVADAISAGQARWVEALHKAAAEAVKCGEVARDSDIDQLIFELLAFQAAADLAAASSNHASIARARRACRDRLKASKPP
jgi:AcrR family transcriptional regulator